MDETLNLRQLNFDNKTGLL